jgi:hypothetical protein
MSCDCTTPTVNDVWELGGFSPMTEASFTVSFPSSDTYYNIVNPNSGMYTDVPGASTTCGATLEQWTADTQPNDQWQFAPVPSDSRGLPIGHCRDAH